MLAVLFWMLGWERLASQYAACQLELEFHKTVRVPGGKTLPVYNDPNRISHLTGKALDPLPRSESPVKHAKQRMRATRTASACAALARPEKRYTLEVLQLEIRNYRQENSPSLNIEDAVDP